MSYEVAIIGAGWYGCHVASSLASLGFRVTVFEKNVRPLHEASGNNQFRLHLGFHYARHHGTRQQSRDGYLRFIERYPNLSAPVEQNIYAVPQGRSLIDFQTYKMIMVSSGIDFIELPGNTAPLHDVEGAMLTRERVLLIDQARKSFQQRLGAALQLGHEVTSIVERDKKIQVNGLDFDYAVDASWGHFSSIPLELIFEPTILLYYEARESFPAVTFVDGPLGSIYPTEDPAIFTLSSVTHTPLARCASSKEARQIVSSVTGDLVARKRASMEAEISLNVPCFNDVFRFVGVQRAIKTKPVGRSDDRSCYVFRSGRMFNVMSGKIDTIFFATERILSMLESENSTTPLLVDHSIRQDIFVPLT